MAGPSHPDVPVAPGVPPVKRDASNPGTAGTPAQTSDNPEIVVSYVNRWGIFTKDGALALDPDSITSMSFDGEFRVADFPIEEGGFESYDKVRLPFEVRVRMTKGGDIPDRYGFLNALDGLRETTDLFDVVTPERTYINVNITRVSLDRSREQGAGLITVDVAFREIVQNVISTFSNTKSPASADPVSNGAVQVKPSDTGLGGVK